MSAQTKPVSDQQTPVIVKSGGGSDTDSKSKDMSVMIYSPIMSFAESVPGLTWESSQSVLTGRIYELSITEGQESPKDYSITPSDELASIIIEYGPAQLQIIESGNPVGNDIVLVIASDGVPFSVEEEGDWKTATATFPDHITRVTFMVGTREVVRRDFINHDITLNIDFLRNTDQ